MSLCLGAEAVWVGTRFVMAKEAGAPPAHQNSVAKTGYHDTIRTIIFTGRPMRVAKTEYIMDWENNRQDEIKDLTSVGKLPIESDIKRLKEDDNAKMPPGGMMGMRPWLMGQCAGAIEDVKPAKEIIDEMVGGAIKILRGTTHTIGRPRL